MFKKLIKKIKEQKKRIMIYSALAASVGLAGALGLFEYNPILKSEPRLKTSLVRSVNRDLEEKLKRLEQNSFTIDVEGNTNPEMEYISIENSGNKPSDNFWLWREGKPNFYNLRILNDSIIKNPKASVREKVLAFYEFFKKHPHFPPPEGGPSPADVDPIKAFAVHGYGWCDTKATNLGAMLELERIPARDILIPAGGGGHTINESGKWCYIDVDLFKYFEDNKRKIMSYEELVDFIKKQIAKDPNLLDTEKGKYFKLFFSKEGEIIYPKIPNRSIQEYLEKVEERYNFRTKKSKKELIYRIGHNMDLTLKPKEKMILNFKRGGILYGNYIDSDLIKNPIPARDEFGGALFSNGTITWQPDIRRINDFLQKGRSLDGTGIIGIKEKGQRGLIFEYKRPFVVVNTDILLSLNTNENTNEKTNLYYNKDKEDSWFYNFRRDKIPWFKDTLPPSWKTLWQNTGNYNGTIQLGEIFGLKEENTLSGKVVRATGIPHYDGRLKLVFPAKANLEKLAIIQTIQDSRLFLDSVSLAPGTNTINYYGGKFQEVKYSQEGEYTTARTRRDDGLQLTIKYKNPK